MQAGAGLAGVLVNGGASAAGATTLELLAGGTATLNASDTDLTVKLDAATNLALGGMKMITVDAAAAGHDTITAGGAGQTLISTGGSDLLDLTDVTAVTTLTYAAGTGQGVLTVSDGTHTAKLTMVGTYTKASFVPDGPDGHGGILIGFT